MKNEIQEGIHILDGILLIIIDTMIYEMFMV